MVHQRHDVVFSRDLSLQRMQVYAGLTSIEQRTIAKVMRPQAFQSSTETGSKEPVDCSLACVQSTFGLAVQGTVKVAEPDVSVVSLAPGSGAICSMPTCPNTC
jgi:hypothetical protein